MKFAYHTKHKTHTVECVRCKSAVTICDSCNGEALDGFYEDEENGLVCDGCTAKQAAAEPGEVGAG